jgi:hypothetical protein
VCSESDTSGDAVLLASLASMPGRLAQMLTELDEEVARRCPLPEEWCVVEAVVHLADVEPRYRTRLERITAEDNLQVPAIWPRAMPDPLPSLPEALAHFGDERAKTVAFLSPLGIEAWERPAQHATLGATTLRKQVQGLIEHDENHLRQIVQAVGSNERR